MANFLTGTVLGGVAAVLALGAASVLLPSRPEVVIAAPAAEPEVAPEVAPTVPAAAPAEPALPKESLLDPAPETAMAKTAVPTEPAPAAPKVELPKIGEPAAAEPTIAGGAKTVVPPAADADKLPNSDGAIAAKPADAVKPAETAPAEAAPVDPAPVEPVTPAIGTPPLVKYAAAFDDPGTKPLFAVILRDTGAADMDRAALAALPFAVTFAIDPESANAAEAMSIYRAAGKEVVMLAAGLPKGATAQDLEQSFQTYETILPETVAVMGAAKGGFQDSATLAKLIVPVVQAQGRGLITFDRGLNAAAQGAQRSGVPHGEVFRQVDGGGESVPVIRRYLDRAVFNAAQTGSAIVMGDAVPDTITALMEWSVEGRASDVTLAPVSALLKVE